MLQPADVSVFRPLKQQWQNTVAQWQSKPENSNRTITEVNFCPVFNEALQSSDMTNAIKNGFKRCGLFPFDPNNVDYTKCVKNTLEQQHASNSIIGSAEETIFSHSDFRVAEKIIKKIGSNLESYGINPQVVLNEIKFFEDEERQQFNNSFGSFVADVSQVASSISEDPIMENIELNEPEVPPSMQILTLETDDQENTVNNLEDQLGATTNGLKKQSSLGFKHTQSIILTRTFMREEPARNSKETIPPVMEDEEIIGCDWQSPSDAILPKPINAEIVSVEILDNTQKQTTTDSTEKLVPQVSEDITINENERQAKPSVSPLESNLSSKIVTIDESDVLDTIGKPVQVMNSSPRTINEVEENATISATTGLVEKTATDSVKPLVLQDSKDITINENERQTLPSASLFESNLAFKIVAIDKPDVLNTIDKPVLVLNSSPRTINEVEENATISVTNSLVEKTTTDSTKPVIPHVSEDITIGEHKRQPLPSESLSSPVTSVKPVLNEITISTASDRADAVPKSSPEKINGIEENIIISVTDGLVQPTDEETAPCSNKENNERIPILTLQGAFKQHLVFPVPQNKKQEAKERLPSAISGEAWREYYTKKENEAKRKIDEKQKRKEGRELKNVNKKPKTGNKVRKNVAKRQVPKPPKKKKINCSLCDDELISDAEEEAERNIGCDFCPRWYHLHCTELNDLPYSVAALQDYKCNLC